MTDKEKQKQLLIEIMEADAKDGLYEPAQTAVEWLQDKIKETYDKEGKLPLGYVLNLVSQAKAMEEKQSFTADDLKAAYYAGYLDAKTNHINDAEQYINARVYLKNK